MKILIEFEPEEVVVVQNILSLSAHEMLSDPNRTQASKERTARPIISVLEKFEAELKRHRDGQPTRDVSLLHKPRMR